MYFVSYAKAITTSAVNVEFLNNKDNKEVIIFFQKE